MYQNNTIKPFNAGLAAFSVISCFWAFQGANAQNLNNKSHKSGQNSYVAALGTLNHDQNLTSRDAPDFHSLDWQQDSLDFTFDLPAADFTESIEFLLTADPRGVHNQDMGLTVQFNDDAPMPLKAQGQGFDARITFDPNKSRAAHNKITIRFDPAQGVKCIRPSDGAWDIDLKDSKLIIKSRPKRRALQFNEFNQFLSDPALAPKRVKISAHNDSAQNHRKTHYEALAAQIIGLNMQKLPNFTTQGQNFDLELIITPRSALPQYIDRKTLKARLGGKTRGAAVFIPRGRPFTLVITGDNDSQITNMLSNLAQRQWPNTRRSQVSLGEIRLEPNLKSSQIRLEQSRAISAIDHASTFSNWVGDDWTKGAKSLRFDVSNPSDMQGEILLRLATTQIPSPNNKVALHLNGSRLGVTKIDTKRKSVAFKIKDGQLRGKDNILSLEPELSPELAQTCSPQAGPNFHLGAGSKIILQSDNPPNLTELSHMAATALPFSAKQGQNSQIIMAGSRQEYHASLKLLARLAKASGEGLVDAQYSRAYDAAALSDSHVLFMGPAKALPERLKQHAPRAFLSAIKGQTLEAYNQISSNIEQFASLNIAQSPRLSSGQTRRIRRGGIAALFSAGPEQNYITGVITNMPQQDYVKSTEALSQTSFWDKITGSVVLWDKETILSAQIALPLPEKTDQPIDTLTGPAEPTKALKTSSQSFLDNANQWAGNMAYNIRQMAGRINFSASSKAVTDKTEPIKEAISEKLNNPIVQGQQKTVLARLFEPSSLLIILAFILAIFGMSLSNGTRERDQD